MVSGLKVRYLETRKRAGGDTYLWNPPTELKQAGAFQSVSLGTDLKYAIAEARKLNAALDRYREGPAKKPLEKIRPRSTAELVEEYKATHFFTDLADSTKAIYTAYLRRLVEHRLDNGQLFGAVQASSVTLKLTFKLYNYYVSASGLVAANTMMAAWQSVYRYGLVTHEDIEVNPFSRMGRKKPVAREVEWTPEQIQAFVATADELGYPSMGLLAMLCYELVQRRADMIRLTWSAYDGQRVYIKQTKRGARVWVPVSPELKTALDKAGPGTDTMLVCPGPKGTRMTKSCFEYRMRLIREKAGLPKELQMRDLRRTGANEGGDAGATRDELMSVGGWQNIRSVDPYVIRNSTKAQSFMEKRWALRKARRDEGTKG